MPPKPPRGILETAIYAADLEAAERFYSEVLGLTPFTREKGRHVFFRCGAGVFLVFNPEVTAEVSEVEGAGMIPAHGAHGPGHMAFRIHSSEIPAWRAHLQTAGVPIESELRWPNGGHSIYFRDPAGNSIELATSTLWGLPEGDAPTTKKTV